MWSNLKEQFESQLNTAVVDKYVVVVVFVFVVIVVVVVFAVVVGPLLICHNRKRFCDLKIKIGA